MIQVPSLLSARRLVCLVLAGFAPAVVLAADPLAIDIFTTTSCPVAVPSPAAMPGVEVKLVDVDTIEKFNAELSERLSTDPMIAQSEIRKRLSTLRPSGIEALRHGAVGLALAAQLGVDRTPAIVFDRKAVIYGLTDLTEALHRYRAWNLESD